MTYSNSNPPIKKLLVTLLLLCATQSSALDRGTKIAQFLHTSWTGSLVPFYGVVGLAQTTDGYIWIASDEGLYRFDGARFTRFEPLPGESMPRTNIKRIVATRDGSVWTVFYSGQVSRVRDGHVTTFSLRELPRTNDLAEDRDGSLVAATAHGGLARFRNGRWQDLAKDLHYSAKLSLAMMFGRDGVLWVLTDDRALRLPPKGDRFIDSGVRLTWLAGPTPAPLSEAPDGTIWLAEYGVSVHTIWPGIRPLEVKLLLARTLLSDRQGSLWIGTADRGLYRMRSPQAATSGSVSLSSPEIEHFGRKNGLSGDRVNSSLQDREGNLWFGTERGLDRFRNAAFRPVDVPDAEHARQAMPLKGGGVLLGYGADRVFARVNPDDSVTLHTPSVSIDHWCHERNGTIWVSTPNGISRLIDDRVSPPVLRWFKPIYLMRCGYDDEVWFNAFHQGVVRFSGGKVKVAAGVLPQVSMFFADGPGRLWGGYRDGRMFLYDQGKYREFGPRDGVPKGQTNQIAKDRAGNLWFASEGGLAKFTGGRFTSVDVGGSVLGMNFDDNGFLWLNVGHALRRMDLREFDRAAANPGYRPFTVAYDALDGIPGPVRLSFKTADGRIWIKTDSGFAFTDPSRLPKDPPPPPVQIETLAVNGKEMHAAQGMSLPAGTRDLQIDYTALSFTAPEHVRFLYKLDGFDLDWRDAGNTRRAYYGNLPPKKYRFLVKASNNNRVWNETGAALDFSIAPAWYQTVAFQIFCGLAAGALLWTTYLLRLRQVAAAMGARFDERLDERMRIARDFHDTLLQTIQGGKMVADDALSKDSDLAQMKRAMVLLAGWLGQATDEGRAALSSLRSSTTEANDLAAALQRACDETHSQLPMEFELSVEGSGRLMHPIARDEVYRIGYEAIRNACNHSGATHLKVTLSYLHGLVLRVQDNGKGFESAVLNSLAERGHFGMIGMYERAARIRAKLTISSSPGNGTQVELIVPRSVVFQHEESAGKPKWRTLWG